jgi:NADH dehydrogenase FAD-containing subunit
VVHLADGRTAEYDVLSLDTGATMDRDRIRGARENAMFVRPIEHFVRLLEGLVAWPRQRVVDVVVVGGGAAGVELALALQYRLAGQGEERARVALVTGGPRTAGRLSAGGDAPRRRCWRRAVSRSFATPAPNCSPACWCWAAARGWPATHRCWPPAPSHPPWLAGSGLQLDVRGFVCTGPTLQSCSHPEVFAAGDVASRVDAPHPRSGVYAVRAGPPLLLNLRRFIAGGALQPYMPQRKTLNLISCGERRAIMAWGDWAAQGRWAWWWKDRIDRQFVARYTRPEPPINRGS